MQADLKLTTERLILRPLLEEDAKQIYLYCSDRDIADTTFAIPHPYSLKDAENFISYSSNKLKSEDEYNFAIICKKKLKLIGVIGLITFKQHERAELGYWIGKPNWGKGYCTEAAKELISFAFEVLKLNKVHSSHILRNPASGKVMQKIGMKHEGRIRQHIKKWDKFEDADFYGILKNEA